MRMHRRPFILCVLLLSCLVLPISNFKDPALKSMGRKRMAVVLEAQTRRQLRLAMLHDCRASNTVLLRYQHGTSFVRSAALAALDSCHLASVEPRSFLLAHLVLSFVMPCVTVPYWQHHLLSVHFAKALQAMQWLQ